MDSRNYSLYQIIDVRIDPTGKLSFRQITDPNNSRLFIQNPTKDLNFGITDNTCWLRFSLVNITQNTLKLSLILNNPDINYVNYYEFIDNKPADSIITGERRVFSSRRYNHRNFVFELNLESGRKYTYYIRANNDGDALTLPVNLSRFSDFLVEDGKNSILIGFVYGLFFFVILSLSLLTL